MKSGTKNIPVFFSRAFSFEKSRNLERRKNVFVWESEARCQDQVTRLETSWQQFLDVKFSAMYYLMQRN